MQNEWPRWLLWHERLPEVTEKRPTNGSSPVDEDMQMKENGENRASKQTNHSYKSTLVWDIKILHLPATSVKKQQQRIKRNIPSQNWSLEDQKCFFLVNWIHVSGCIMRHRWRIRSRTWFHWASCEVWIIQQTRGSSVMKWALYFPNVTLINTIYHLNTTANTAPEHLHPFYSWLQFIHTQADASSQIT